MSEPTQVTPTVIALPSASAPQTFDPKGVVEAAQGMMPNDSKGFMPLTNFDPNQPYKSYAEFLSKQREDLEKDRQRVASDDPKTFFEGQTKKLEGEKKTLEDQHKADLQARLDDLLAKYQEQIAALSKYHGGETSWRDAKIGELESRINTLKSEIKALEAQHISDNDQRIEENARHYEQRLADMKEHSDKLCEAMRNADSLAWSRIETIRKLIEESVKDRESKLKVREFLGAPLLKTAIITIAVAITVAVLSPTLALMIKAFCSK